MKLLFYYSWGSN